MRKVVLRQVLRLHPHSRHVSAMHTDDTVVARPSMAAGHVTTEFSSFLAWVRLRLAEDARREVRLPYEGGAQKEERRRRAEKESRSPSASRW